MTAPTFAVALERSRHFYGLGFYGRFAPESADDGDLACHSLGMRHRVMLTPVQPGPHSFGRAHWSAVGARAAAP